MLRNPFGDLFISETLAWTSTSTLLSPVLISQQEEPISFISNWRELSPRQSWEDMHKILAAVMVGLLPNNALALLDKIRLEWEAQGFVWTERHSYILRYGSKPRVCIDTELDVRGFEIQICFDNQPTDKVIRFTTTRSR